MRLLPLIGLLLAQQPDSTQVEAQLDSTVFVAERRVSLLDTRPSLPIGVNTELLRRIPSITGTPDPIRIVKLLPGVETGSELDAGLHILGTENSHSLVSVDGVPIYGATHILGLFSTFISSILMRYSVTLLPAMIPANVPITEPHNAISALMTDASILVTSFTYPPKNKKIRPEQVELWNNFTT